MQTEEYTTGVRDLTAENIIKFTEAFMINNQTDPDSVLLEKAVIVSDEDSEDCYVEICAGFPGALVGIGGVTAKKLASTMTKFFNRNLKLNIKH